jgi:hypothetical protein
MNMTRGVRVRRCSRTATCRNESSGSARGRAVELIQQLALRALVACIDERSARSDGQAAALAVEDVGEHSPGAEDLDLAGESRSLVEPLEHRDVRIRTVFIGIESRIGRSGRHLVVAGIGEPHRVRDVRDAARLLVAEELSLLCNGAPQKWKQEFAPHGRVVVPVLVLELIGRSPVTAGVSEERRIGARKHLLPAHAVGDHEDHVLRLACPCDRGAGQASECDEDQLRESEHGWLHPLSATAESAM